MLKRLTALSLYCLALLATWSSIAYAEIARSAWAEEEQSAVRLSAARDG